MGAIHGRGYYDRIGLGEACFQVHGVDAEEATVLRKQLRSSVECRAVWSAWRRARRRTTGVACAWPRGATDAGAIREAYIKRNKHDAADAEAICEAVHRPTMRFVPVKMAEQ